MEPWRAFLVALGALALLLQPGPFLNDEVGQMAALTSLARGELLVQPDLPEGYEVFRYWGGMNVPPPGGEPRPNAGSTMTTILALPLLAVLRTLELALGPMGAVGLLAAGAVAAGVWAWRTRSDARSSDTSATSGAAGPADVGPTSTSAASERRHAGPTEGPHSRAWEAAIAGAILLAGALTMQAAWRPPSSPYLEAAALQMLNVAFHAFATALVYDMLRTRVERPVLGAALYALGTPALFWTLSLKYHGMGVALAAIVVWLYQEGHRTGPLRTGLAFTVAGLAVWNHLPNGLLVLGSLGLMALPAITLGWRPLAARAGAGLAGLALGILPEIVDRAVHRSLEVRDRVIEVAGGADLGQQIERQGETGRLQWAAWNDPSGPFDALRQLVFWTDRATPHVGDALPMLALVPLVAVVPWAYRRLRADPLMVWPIVHFAVLLVLFGRGVFRNGGGFDMRHASTLWPYLALPLALVADRARSLGRTALSLVAGMALVVWLPFFVARQQKGFSALTFGPVADLVEPLRYIGVAGAGAVLVVWAVPRLHRWRPQATAVAIAWAWMVQVLLQLGPARSRGEGGSFPFVAWPVAGLEWLVERLLMDVW